MNALFKPLRWPRAGKVFRAGIHHRRALVAMSDLTSACNVAENIYLLLPGTRSCESGYDRTPG